MMHDFIGQHGLFSINRLFLGSGDPAGRPEIDVSCTYPLGVFTMNL